MTLPFGLTPLAAKVIGGVVLVALAIGAFMFWLDNERQEAVEADRSASSAKAVSSARKADERADEAATGAQAGIQKGNDDAKAAAAGSDDPLADGLRSLRDNAKGADRPSTR